MKLYLSSYRLGRNISYLQKWLKENGNQIIVIPNAIDVLDGDIRKEKIIDKCSDLENIGFKTEILDLRNYFGKENELKEFLQNKRAFYTIGGNVFVLNRAMKLSGFDNYLLSKIADEKILYSGFSAGICVLAQNLDGLHLVDDSEVDPYKSGIKTKKGIGILEYVPVPHYKSNHPESTDIDKVIEYLNKKKLKYKTLQDGDVIIESTTIITPSRKKL